MYLGAVSVLLGATVLLGSLAALLAPIAMLITLEILFIRRGEKSLEETFGKEYLEYKKRVGRWL